MHFPKCLTNVHVKEFYTMRRQSDEASGKNQSHYVQCTWERTPAQAEQHRKTEPATWTSRLRRRGGRKPTWLSLTTSAAPAAQSAPVHRTTSTAGQTSDWKLGRQSSVTAFPESTPFKLTIWNILGALQKKGGHVPRSSLLQPLRKKKRLRQTSKRTNWACGKKLLSSWQDQFAWRTLIYRITSQNMWDCVLSECILY